MVEGEGGSTDEIRTCKLAHSAPELVVRHGGRGLAEALAQSHVLRQRLLQSEARLVVGERARPGQLALQVHDEALLVGGQRRLLRELLLEARDLLPEARHLLLVVRVVLIVLVLLVVDGLQAVHATRKVQRLAFVCVAVPEAKDVSEMLLHSPSSHRCFAPVLSALSARAAIVKLRTLVVLA